MEQLRNLAEWYQKNKALLNTLGSFLLVILGAIYALSLQSGKLLFQSSIIVNWFLLLISLFAIIGGVVVFSWLFRNLNPWGYSRFNQMAYQGTLWKWKWMFGLIYDLHPICSYPHCGRRKRRITPSGDYFDCYECNNSAQYVPITEEGILETIKREIRYQTVKGGWRELVNDPWKNDPKSYSDLQEKIRYEKWKRRLRGDDDLPPLEPRSEY